MAEDINLAIDHVVNILTEALTKRKEEGVDLERKVRNFWDKLKKRLPEEVSTEIQENPSAESSKIAFKKGMEELMNAQNVKMSVVVFLYDQGVEL